MIYLDNQATTRCDPRVLSAMLPLFAEEYGNPASAEHAMGRAAEAAVEAARENVAALIGASPAEIAFTSGATESNNLAIKGAARHALRQGDPRRRIVTTATEHKCVLQSVADLADEGFEPVVLPVGRDGLVDHDRLREALRAPTLLVSVMAANNETGVLQDISALGAIAREAGALFHTDAAQAAGKVPVDVGCVDLLSVSAHKLYGPKGVGALYVRRRPRVRLSPLFSGGGQERGLRSGTLPVALLAGFGAACRIAVAEMAADADRAAAIRSAMLSRLSDALPGLRVNGAGAPRLPGSLNIALPGASASAVIEACPELCVSTGSACSSAAVEPSYVLRAMGLSDAEARRCLRIGIGRFTSRAEADAAATSLAAAALKLAEREPARDLADA
jgi:cysteine desulfurase